MLRHLESGAQWNTRVIASYFSNDSFTTVTKFATEPPAQCKDFVVVEANLGRRFWNVVLGLMLFYIATVSPYRICMLDVTSDITAWNRFDYSIEFLFLVDVILNFFFSYRDGYGREILDLPSVMWHYLRGFFGIDVILLQPALLEIVIDFAGTRTRSSKRIGFARVFRLFKLVKLLRLQRFNRLKDKMGSSSIMYTIDKITGVRFLKLVLSLLWVMHIFACLLYMVANLHNDLSTTWVGRRGIEGEEPLNLWMHSMYFVMTTFTTVGYGDMSAYTNGEMVFACIMMLAGALVNGIILSEIVTVFTSLDRESLQSANMRSLVDEFAQHTDLNVQLKQELVIWASSLKKVKRDVGSEEVTKLINCYLPRSLLKQLSEEVFNGKVYRNNLIQAMMRYGMPVPIRLPLRIAVSLTQWHYIEREAVYFQGDYSWELFLVSCGTFAYVASLAAMEDDYAKLVRESTALIEDNFTGFNSISRKTPAHALRRRKADALLRQTSEQMDRKPFEAGGGAKLFPYQLFSCYSYFGDIEVMSGAESSSRLCCARCESAEGGTVLKLSKDNFSLFESQFPSVTGAWRALARKRHRASLRKLAKFMAGLSYRELAATTIQQYYRKRGVVRQDIATDMSHDFGFPGYLDVEPWEVAAPEACDGVKVRCVGRWNFPAAPDGTPRVGM
mmetsp:Transcript_115569/g.326721  ORF Transcript_115569/g.326721 Transcript_115569/m.326721 type:complete len:671 (-) Transcript_115569:125-2137(-)|eukprot:CAMPEP_0117556116 /NCGR_PEP_ID=MMETSP0784-20121206/51634_1 /TAXON_ID=39447 /ORGANISM="" /LENGTH=670 /DNA_ID=CAMNT_0005353363 /DNA_START=69 /DNA_END=2081 /DNA_ORIENTATION=+